MSGRFTLLTGATGLVGTVTCLQGLQSDPADRWLLLIRGADEAAARTRLVARFSRLVAPGTARELAARCEIIRGDLATIEVAEDPRLERVTHILHAAADTSWRSRSANLAANFHGTASLARRARRMGGLQRFLHVSTAMVCGAGAPSRLVREDEPLDPHAPHLVSYTASKAEAERSLRADFADLPLVIARPSIVVGHTRLGCVPEPGLFWAVRVFERLRMLPFPADGGIDFIPVDWTADALLHLLRKPSLAWDCYHISGSAAGQTRTDPFARSFARFLGEPTPSYEPVGRRDHARFRSRFAQCFDRADPGVQLMARAQWDYVRFGDLNLAFDNTRLLAEDFPQSMPMPDYLVACLASCRDQSIVEQFEKSVRRQ